MSKLPPLFKASKDPSKRGPRRRIIAVARDEHILTYECLTCGGRFRYVEVDPAGRPMVFGARMMERWHSKEKGGCSGTCPHCRRKHLKELRER